MVRGLATGHIPRLSPSGLSLLFVAAAATLLGTEGMMRRPLLDEMSMTAIVLAEHLLMALFAVPVVVAQRRVLARLSLRTWGVMLVIGVGSSGGAALLFMKALETGSPTTASLLQNTQSLFVVFLAYVFLKERVRPIFWPCLGISLTGAYLLSFGTMSSVSLLGRDELIAVGCALGAAALWANGTVMARMVLSDVSYVTLAAMRILLALPFLWLVALSRDAVGETVSGIAALPPRLLASAFVIGLVALLLFYRGLQGTRASYAVLAEFMYPASARSRPLC